MTETADLDGKCFVLTGPMKIADPMHTPVRGDLAHIGLAGRYFVPHYAVPITRRITTDGAELRASSRADSDVLTQLDGGSLFEVLDIAGSTAWGQAGGENGFVGYVALDRLEAET